MAIPSELNRRITRDGCIMAQRAREISALKTASALIEPRRAVSSHALGQSTIAK
jgi:hypothetical protein